MVYLGDMSSTHAGVYRRLRKLRKIRPSGVIEYYDPIHVLANVITYLIAGQITVTVDKKLIV
jgi:hypothetical protein